jgi:hypothetical protein
MDESKSDAMIAIVANMSPSWPSPRMVAASISRDLNS